MPQIKPVGGKYQIAIDRFDGGLNTKDAPSRIGDNETPDSLNCVYDDTGSVKTREGTTYLNTSPTSTIGTNVFDGLTTYKGTMVAWAGGSMYRLSGTVFDKVTTSSGKFASGVNVAYQQFQNILFCSEGTNGPYRWEGGESFYNQGISAPSAPSSVSNGAGDIAAGTYFYKVSFLNSHAVEGDVGSASAGTTLAASAAIAISGVPVGSGLNGVAKRWIYRANSAAAAYKFVKELSDNTTTSFTDTVSVGSEGGSPIADGRAPTPYTTIELHKDVLFWDDSSNRTLLRYSEYSNPFISPALNFEALNQGDGSNILAIGVQQDFLSVFKGNSIWVKDLVDPSDETTWVTVKSPSALGIVGSRALEMVDNGILFIGQQNGRVTGFHILSGVDLPETANQLVRSKSISEKIESNLLGLNVSQLADAAMFTYDNKVHIALHRLTTSLRNDGIFWFDINRLGSDGQPGSWSPWAGDVGVNDFTVYNGLLYGGSSLEDGRVLQFYNGTFTDASGAGIDSYFWTKEFGGEDAIESWTKDARFINLWYALFGSYEMTVRWRKDGDSGVGTFANIDLTPPGDLWGTMIWGTGMWSAGGTKRESQISLGALPCRRIQVRFENLRSGGSPVANRGFQVFSLKALMNLRRQRG